MNLNKRQKHFIVIASIATIVAIFSRTNVLGLTVKPYPNSPNGTQIDLVVDNKQASSTTEELGRNCLPEGEAAGAELIGEYQNPSSTELFQVWKLNLTPNHFVLRVNGLYGTTCLYAYDERYNKTIGDDLSQEDAQQVALVIWQYRADNLGGTDELQESFNNSAAELEQSNEAGYVSAEDKWALETLGIRIPSVYEIYDPENPPQLRRSQAGDA